MKLLKELLLLLFVSMLLSCSDDDSGTNPNTNDLVGEWKLFKVVREYSDGTITVNERQSDLDLVITTYYEDGTYIQSGDVNRSGTWSIAGKDLSMTKTSSGSNSTNVYVYEISGSELKLSNTYENTDITSHWEKQ